MQKSSHDKKYARILAALKDARLAAGLTQTDVARRFGAHASFVSKCESGERRIDVLELVGSAGFMVLRQSHRILGIGRDRITSRWSDLGRRDLGVRFRRPQ